MRFFRIVPALVIALAMGAVSSAAMNPTVVLPSQVKWQPQPGNFSMAVVYGDPSKSGFYVMRLKLPANWSFPVHYHPNQENVTVLSGTFYAGIGKKFDAKKAMAFPAGSFIAVPANLPHFALTKGPAIIQLEGQGPSKDVMMKK